MLNDNLKSIIASDSWHLLRNHKTESIELYEQKRGEYFTELKAKNYPIPKSMANLFYESQERWSKKINNPIAF